MIRLENVSKYYASGDNNVSLGLHNISLEMKKGEIIGIVGESGSGKSTFLNVVSGLDTFEDGEVYYGDTPVSSFTPEELGEFRKNHIGFIFQNYNLIDSYTVLQNVLMPLLIKGVTGKEAKEKAKEIIKKVGLEHRINHKGTKLSGGEKQRCVIARALASDSEILACDEPTGNLDSKTGREIIELIKEVAKDKLVLIVTHNYDELKDIITRRLTFADGNLIEDKDLTSYEAENDELSPNSTYKFSFKEKLKLSSKDILSTPKKTILSFLIFIAISAFVAYLYTGLLTYKNSYSDPSIFSNSLNNRYIVYEKDKPFNYDDFKDGNYYNYANIEDEQFSFSCDSVSKGSFYYKYDLSDVKLKKGRMPETDNEIIIGVPEQTLQTCYKNSVTISIFPKYYNDDGLINIDDSKYEVVGYYNIPDTSMNTYLITGTDYLKNKLVDSYLAYDFYSKTGSFWLNDSVLSTQIKINNEVEKNVINFYFSKELEG
ncbi:MAG: ABC transporter ATP-binding protein, partial [bacterium]|nr:ABC transporter ATP-binding protein [bacterium]